MNQFAERKINKGIDEKEFHIALERKVDDKFQLENSCFESEISVSCILLKYN